MEVEDYLEEMALTHTTLSVCHASQGFLFLLAMN